MFFLENTEHIFKHIFKLHNFNIFQARFQIRIPKNSARISRFVDIHWIPMLLSGLSGRSTKESPNQKTFAGSTQSSEPPNAPNLQGSHVGSKFVQTTHSSGSMALFKPETVLRCFDPSHCKCSTAPVSVSVGVTQVLNAF